MPQLSDEASSSSSSDDTVSRKAVRPEDRDDSSTSDDSTVAIPKTLPSVSSKEAEHFEARQQTASSAHSSQRGMPLSTQSSAADLAGRCLAESCSGRLSADICRDLLPSPTDRHLLRQAETEASIPQDQRFWCPLPSCARVFKLDPKAAKSPPSKCPHCQQPACLRCQQPWAEGHSCRKVKEAGMDTSVMQLAQDKRWRQCPCCRQMVEKRGGCNAIRCKCSCEFCYVCGKMSSNCECWARMTRMQRAVSVIGGVIFCCLCCPCVAGLVVYECYHHN
ncbi:hypothetical protein WJX73_008022 [Symbiochloris irregularis]|uniref:RBR-type E3 ubiquitin transferase n=1 Tax=Symbiochloris irregularis TaxID=706552 RepID=A0AAW1PI51_9CHLO